MDINSNQIKTKPDEQIAPENSTRLLKLERFSDPDREAFINNPKAFPLVGTGALGVVPDVIDSFKLEEKDKIKLFFGLDIGDKKAS